MPSTEPSPRSGRVSGGVAVIARDCGEVPGDVPRPQLHDVPVGIREVDRAPVVGPEGVLGHRRARRAQPRHDGVVVGLGDVHREMDVRAALAAGEPDLRAPQPDPRALARHHPDRLAVRPALDDRHPEQAGVERLGHAEVLDLEHEL